MLKFLKNIKFPISQKYQIQENANFSKSQNKAKRENAKLQLEKLKKQEKSIQQRNEERIKKLRRQAPSHSVQETVKYRNMFEDGICEVEEGLYSKCFKISDINYQIAKYEEQKDIFAKYCELLNYCDSSIHLQVSIINKMIDEDDFRKNMFSQLNNDPLDLYRKEMNSILSKKVLEGQNNILREKYITFSTQANSYINAIPILSRVESDLISQFRSLGCDVQVLSGLERLKLIYDINCPEQKFDWGYDNLIVSSLTTKSAVCPTSFNFKNYKNQFELGDTFGQVLFLKDLPADLSDTFVSLLSDSQINLSINLHIDNIPQDKAFSLVKGKLSFMEQQKIDEQRKAQQKGYDANILPFELTHSLEEGYELLDDLQKKNQRLFKFSMLIYTYAKDLDELNKNVSQIVSTARKKNCRVSNLDYLQEEAINSIYPLGKNHVPIERTLTTASTAIFIPFTTQELQQKNGLYYGLNSLSHNLIFFDRKLLKTPNGI